MFTNKKFLAQFVLFLSLFVGLCLWVILGFKNLRHQALLSAPDRSMVEVRVVGESWLADLPDSQFGSESVNLNKSSDLAPKVFKMELVNSDASRAQGLSSRREIGSDGMMFIMPRPSRHVFWMKDMLFPIDIVWLSEGKVVDVTTAQLEKCSTCPDLKTYTPRVPADMVIEVPLGQAAVMGLRVGSRVEIQFAK